MSQSRSSRTSITVYAPPHPDLPSVPAELGRALRRERLARSKQSRRCAQTPEQRRRVSIAPPPVELTQTGTASLTASVRSTPHVALSGPRTTLAADQLDHTTGVLLGSIAGAVDAAGWVCLAGLLPSHLTASLVILGASLGEHESADVSARLAMIPAFIITVALVKWLAGWLSARKLPVLAPLLTLLTLALGVFCVAGALSDKLLADDPRVLLGVGGIGVASMAVQNTIMRLCLTTLNPTTVMTGNLTQFVMASVDLTSRQVRRAQGVQPLSAGELDALRRLKCAGLPLLGFVVGSVASGYLASLVGLLSLLLPLSLAAVTTVLAWRRIARARPAPPAASRRHTPGRAGTFTGALAR